MRRSRMAAAAVAAALTTGCSDGPPPREDLPRVMAALGDSMTRAYLLCDGAGDCPEASWSTGTEVDSHYRRLRDLGGRVKAHNLAVSGATVGRLAEQARAAVATGAGYVTVLIGANDACAPTESSMTPVEDFRRAFADGMDTLVRGLPEAKVLVTSIPDLLRLWEVGKDSPEVRATWARGICQSMLARPESDAAADAARRGRVRARVEAFNAVMAEVCARYDTCRWDGGAVFGYRFGLDAVSERDYWHPSREGQRLLSAISWDTGWFG